MGLAKTYEGHPGQSSTRLDQLVPTYDGNAGGEWYETAYDESGDHVTVFADNFEAATQPYATAEDLQEVKNEIYRRAGIVAQTEVHVEAISA